MCPAAEWQSRPRLAGVSASPAGPPEPPQHEGVLQLGRLNAGVHIERDSFLAALSALADEALNGAGGRLAFLGGEAGVGKSALAALFAASTAERMSVRRGGCDNVATPAALGPLFDAVPELS